MPEPIKRLLTSLVIGWILVGASAGYASESTTKAVPETTPEPEDEKPLGMVGRATVYVDGAQAKASERLSSFMTQVDGFFSDAAKPEDAVSNQSWARIRLDAKRPGGGDVKVKPSVKIRLVLPETERRFKLLLSTEDDDSERVGENVARTREENSFNDQNASVALRFIRSARAKGSVKLDLGVRQRDSAVQYFTRLNTGYRGKIWRTWDIGITNSYYYFSKSGFEDNLTFDLRRVFFDTEHTFFRSFTEFNWRNGRKGSNIGQTLGLYTQFGERKWLALETLAGYYTALNDDVTDRFRGHEIRLRWRHNVWRPWFFYEVWPSVSWPSINGYRKSYGALLRLEVIVGQR